MSNGRGVTSNRDDRDERASSSGPLYDFAGDWDTLTTLARAWATTAPRDQREKEKRETEALIRRLEKAIGKGKCRGETPYGEAAPDA